MTEISDEIMKVANECHLTALGRGYRQAVEVIARAIMAREAKARDAALEEAAAKVKELGAVIDHPSIYMGGPSRDAKRKVEVIAIAIRAMRTGR
jgi:hypothetical protein